MKLVSVIVPIYNVERYLETCVRSIMNQSLKEIEIICVNDGSTDSSPRILTELANEDKRIKVINKKNSGYGHSMNVGLQAAKGEYVAIVESDDYIHECMLEKLYFRAKKSDVDFVKSNFIEFTESSSKLIENLSALPYDRVLTSEDYGNLYYVTPSIWSSIYKRSFLSENGIWFNETPGASFQDVSFYHKTLLCAQRILLLKEGYLFYRQDNSSSSIHSENKIFCILDEFKELGKFVEDNNINETFHLKHLNHIEFRSYLRIYDSLSEVFKYAYLLRLVDIYIDRINRLNTDLFTADELVQINQIIESPFDFFKTRNDYVNNWLSLTNSVHFAMNSKVYVEAILNEIRMASEVYIYGAGVIGKEVLNHLQKSKIENVKGFCVTSNVDDEVVMGYPVNKFENIIKSKPEALFLVSTTEKYQFEILKYIKDCGVSNSISMNLELRRLLDKVL